MNSKLIMIVFGCLLPSLGLLAQSPGKYVVKIDLTNVVDDRIEVNITPPAINENTLEFHIPKIVPGTYSIYNFGRFTTDFRALDKDGKELVVDSISPNIRAIQNATELAQIFYWVEDSYDTKKGNFIFEPAGTNIEEGKNFILNTFGFIGYFKGYKNHAYELQIKRPENFFGATSLDQASSSDNVDVFSASNYFDLADAPIMYSEPDTATFKVGNTDILISVYSPNKKLSSDYVASQIEPTLRAQQAYLGGTLPVKKYAFLVYLHDGPSGSGGMGALEHSYSSLYSLPEINPLYLSQVIRDVAAHEFFHVVTPLNIHAEQIGDFDFIEPKMSKHLWMYEGVTEYAAGLAQVKYGDMSDDKYIEVLLQKIKSSENYNDTLPFTTLSKECLGKHKGQYANVYEKGALIGLALDVQLLELSNGRYGIQNLMNDLSEKYGKKKSFKDEELFGVIESLTYPEIGDFFEKYVEGSEKLPYVDIFKKVGVEYISPSKNREISLGHISFAVNDKTKRLIINSIDAMNVFGKNMGYKAGDEILKFDGNEVDIANFEAIFSSFKDNHKVGDKIKAIVLRKDSKGKLKKQKLSAKAVDIEIKTERNLRFFEETNEEQLLLRTAWIGKS